MKQIVSMSLVENWSSWWLWFSCIFRVVLICDVQTALFCWIVMKKISETEWSRFLFCSLSFIVYEALSLVCFFFVLICQFYWPDEWQTTSVCRALLILVLKQVFFSSAQIFFKWRFLKILCDLFVSFLGRSWPMWCANCVILLIHDERIIWKRKFFSLWCLSIIVRYQCFRLSLLNDESLSLTCIMINCEFAVFLMDLAVKQFVFVSFVKNAFGAPVLLCFLGWVFMCCANFVILLIYDERITWKRTLTYSFLSFGFCGFLWSILLSLFNVPRDLLVLLVFLI